LLRSWRIKQERKLKTKKNINSKVMTNKEVKRFMMTYERITLQMFKDMPKISKVVLSLNKFHQINNIRFAS
jgi:D-glycerate 3-kinase